MVGNNFSYLTNSVASPLIEILVCMDEKLTSSSKSGAKGQIFKVYRQPESIEQQRSSNLGWFGKLLFKASRKCHFLCFHRYFQ